MKRSLAFIVAAVAIALATSGCSSTLSDAATIHSTLDGTTHSGAVSRKELISEVRKLVANKPFATWLKENKFAVNSDASADSALSAIWLSQLIRQQAIDELFDARHLRVSPAARAQAATDVVNIFPTADVYPAFDARFRATLAARQERADALLLSYSDTSDAAGRRYFRTHEAQFTCASGRNVAHVLVTTPSAAQQILGMLRGGASFAALARQYSTDTQSAVKGGKLGCLTPGAFVPGFQRVAEAAPFDTPIGPVRSQFGYHVILVTHATPSYEASRAGVRQALAQAGQTAVQRAIDEFLKASTVHVDPRFGTWGLAADAQGQRGYRVSAPAAPHPRSERG